MRVGLLAYGPDPPLSGVGRYTVELARSLAAVAPPLRLTLLTAGRRLAAGGLNGFSTSALPGCQRLPGLLTLGNWMVPAAARRLGLDIVHDLAGVAPFAFGAGGARTVVTVHDVFARAFPGTNTRLEALLTRQWLPRLLPKVGMVITDSLASRADIVRYLNVRADKVLVIPLGVNALFRCPPGPQVEARLARLSIPAGYILFVGSLDSRRNLPGLLQAYAKLHEQGERRPLVIAGARRGQGQAIARELATLGLGNFVQFVGQVADADLPALYGGADLFVFPSLYEGFGLPPLEAMACGAPVVCSNAASLPEVVGDAALTFDANSVEAMAGAMQRALSDGDLRGELRRRGLERARQFTWERTASETLRVYQQVLGQA